MRLEGKGSVDNKFGGVIWTNHALARMRERGIKQSDAWATWRAPDQSRYANSKNVWVYHKTLDNVRIEVVAKKNERNEWLILSVWSKKSEGKTKHKGLNFTLLVKKIFG